MLVLVNRRWAEGDSENVKYADGVRGLLRSDELDLEADRVEVGEYTNARRSDEMHFHNFHIFS